MVSIPSPGHRIVAEIPFLGHTNGSLGRLWWANHNSYHFHQHSSQLLLVGGWTNPFPKICSSKWVHLPQGSGWKLKKMKPSPRKSKDPSFSNQPAMKHNKYLSCHHHLGVKFIHKRHESPKAANPSGGALAFSRHSAEAVEGQVLSFPDIVFFTKLMVYRIIIYCIPWRIHKTNGIFTYGISEPSTVRLTASMNVWYLYLPTVCWLLIVNLGIPGEGMGGMMPNQKKNLWNYKSLELI